MVGVTKGSLVVLASQNKTKASWLPKCSNFFLDDNFDKLLNLMALSHKIGYCLLVMPDRKVFPLNFYSILGSNFVIVILWNWIGCNEGRTYGWLPFLLLRTFEWNGRTQGLEFDGDWFLSFLSLHLVFDLKGHVVQNGFRSFENLHKA
jgi:hypothetical protein